MSDIDIAGYIAEMFPERRELLKKYIENPIKPLNYVELKLDMPEKRTITVLDHGFVRLVDSMGSDLSIVRAARNSHAAAWRAGEDEGSDKKLIRYLMKNRHSTPFESVVFTFEVKLPIFVVRQWHRHRTWSYNEVSARYTELPEEFYVPMAKNVGSQSKSNKQGRWTDADSARLAKRGLQIQLMREQMKSAFDLYHELLADDWPRELARLVLPVSTYTKMFATVNLHNLLHFLGLRDHPHAQWEVREYAKALKELAKQVAPVAIEAWEEFHGKEEIEALKEKTPDPAPTPDLCPGCKHPFHAGLCFTTQECRCGETKADALAQWHKKTRAPEKTDITMVIERSGGEKQAFNIRGLHFESIKTVPAPCPDCRQILTVGVTGEYPCQTCGMPRTHDAG